MTDTETHQDIDIVDKELELLQKKSPDQVQREIRQLQKENNSLSRRLLGVNELARLLQEKSEKCETLQDRNQRLELALVRLENRCSNFEMKLMNQQFSSLPSDVNATPTSISSNRTGGGGQQSPFIPGPSRQILEQLMKDNTDLRNTINGLKRKGPKGFIEAVKMNHLEEVIDQKNDKISLLQKQIATLTAPPTEDEGSGGNTIDPGALKRQLLKMEQSMKVKDRFCTLLSERIDQLQGQLHKGTDLPDGPDTARRSSDGGLEPDIKEKNSRKIIEQLQKQVEEERTEKKEFISKLEESDRKASELEKKNTNLQQKLDNFSAYTDTLMSEKKDMEKQMERLSGQYHPSTQVTDMEQTITKLKDTHRQEIGTRNKEIDNLKSLLEDARMKYAMAESMKISPDQITGLHDTIKELEEEKLTMQDEISRHLETITNLQISRQKSQYGGSGHSSSSYRTGGVSTQPMTDFTGQEIYVMDTVKGKTQDVPLHCGTNIIDNVIRHEVPPINTKPRCATDDSKEEISTTSTTSYSQSPSNKALPLTIAGGTGGVLPSYKTSSNPPSTPHGRPNTAPMSPNTVDPIYYQQGGVYQGGDPAQSLASNYQQTHTYRSNSQPQQQPQGQVADRTTSSLGGASPSPIARSQSPYAITSVYQTVPSQGTYHTVSNRLQPSSSHYSGPIFGQQGSSSNATYGQSNPGIAYTLNPQFNHSGEQIGYSQRHSGEQTSYGGGSSSYMVGQGGASSQFPMPSGQLFGSQQQPTSYNYHYNFASNAGGGGSYSGNPGQYGYGSNAGGAQQGGQGSQQHRRNSPPGGRSSYEQHPRMN